MARTWLILVLFHCGIAQAADDQQSILNIIMSESESRQGKINSLMEYFEKNEKQKIAEELIYAVNKMETFYGENRVRCDARILRLEKEHLAKEEAERLKNKAEREKLTQEYENCGSLEQHIHKNAPNK